MRARYCKISVPNWTDRGWEVTWRDIDFPIQGWQVTIWGFHLLQCIQKRWTRNRLPETQKIAVMSKYASLSDTFFGTRVALETFEVIHQRTKTLLQIFKRKVSSLSNELCEVERLIENSSPTIILSNSVIYLSIIKDRYLSILE